MNHSRGFRRSRIDAALLSRDTRRALPGRMCIALPRRRCRTAIGREVTIRSRQQTVARIIARGSLTQLRVDLRLQHPAPGAEGVPSIGEAGLVAEDRIFLR